MDPIDYSVETLFEQLGLPSDEASQAQFVEKHAPVPTKVELPDAGFWTPAQAGFLRESLASDSPWALPVDELDARLR